MSSSTTHDTRRLALGCITRFIESPNPYREFIKNVRDHGHDVDFLIIALTRTADVAVLAELNEIIPIEVIEMGEDQDIPDELVAAGAHGSDVASLLDSNSIEVAGLVPFCAQRNAVMLKALMLGVDALCFFDHNMKPVELVGAPEAQSGRSFRPVDFLGTHLAALEAGSAVTTGGYSGYDAFPPLQITTLRDLLHGIGREDAYEVISAEGALSGLYLAPEIAARPRPAHQAFAGNLGINLDKARDLPPFFSRWFHLGNDIVLSRGEDTLLGVAAVEGQIGCTDVGTRVFLDPHGTYPDPPVVSHPRMRDRLYWNCLGWIARLPLLDHVRHSAGLLDWDPEELLASRRLALRQGASDLSETLNDNRFLDLPTFFDLVHMRLARTIEEYDDTRRAWMRVVDIIRPQ